MCRRNRVKDNKSTFHVMGRCSSDIFLFREDSDRDRFLLTIKKYQERFLFKIYAYCLMGTHYHLILDPNGADLSTIMHGINQSYAQYYNTKYQRRGHVFQDRFNSKLIHSVRYLLCASAYVHNNPSTVKGFENKIEEYKYSSLGTYLGLTKDHLKLLDTSHILEYFDGNSETYLSFIKANFDKKLEIETELEIENNDYRSEKKVLMRNLNHKSIINMVAEHTGINALCINFKNLKEYKIFAPLCIALMHTLGNMSYKQIGEVIGNITLSAISRLASLGYSKLLHDEKYIGLITKLVEV